MKVFSLPAVVRCLVFDIDNTLYRHEGYVRDQNMLLIARLARERGIQVEIMAEQVERYRAEQAAKDEGRRPSLGNAFVHFGVPIELSVRWREEELSPENYLSVDPELDELLTELASRYKLGCVTNNPSAIGRRTLSALGIERHFPVVIGLDDSMVSKPHIVPFQKAVEALNCVAGEMISIGDRYEIDIEPALQLGMGGILVESRADLFSLPILEAKKDTAWT